MRDGGLSKTDILSLAKRSKMSDKILALWEKKNTSCKSRVFRMQRDVHG